MMSYNLCLSVGAANDQDNNRKRKEKKGALVVALHNAILILQVRKIGFLHVRFCAINKYWTNKSFDFLKAYLGTVVTCTKMHRRPSKNSLKYFSYFYFIFEENIPVER